MQAGVQQQELEGGQEYILLVVWLAAVSRGLLCRGLQMKGREGGAGRQPHLEQAEVSGGKAGEQTHPCQGTGY